MPTQQVKYLPGNDKVSGGLSADPFGPPQGQNPLAQIQNATGQVQPPLFQNLDTGTGGYRNLSPEELSAISGFKGTNPDASWDSNGMRQFYDPNATGDLANFMYTEQAPGRTTGVGNAQGTTYDYNGIPTGYITGKQSGGTWGTQSVPVWDEKGNFIGMNSGDSTALGLMKFIAASVGGYYGANYLNGLGAGAEGLSGLDAAMVDMGAGATNVGAGTVGTTAGAGAGTLGTLAADVAAPITGTVTNLGTIPATVGATGGSTLAATLTKLATDPKVWQAALPFLASIGDDGKVNGRDLGQMKPEEIISMFQGLNRNNSNDAIDQSRYNVVGPDGSSTWSKTPNFDQAGYDTAMARWRQAGNANLPQPSKEQFTTYTWTNTQQLSPDAKLLNDKSDDINLRIANWLSGPEGLAGLGSKLATGADRSKIPDFVYSFDGQKVPLGDASMLPTYKGVTGNEGDYVDPRYGTVNRGDIQKSIEALSRNYGDEMSPAAMEFINRMAGMDAWMFDDKGADAMYRTQTRYLDPKHASDQKAMEARLAEQGFVPGVPGYENALRQLLDAQAMERDQARDKALIAGREYGNQAFDNMAGVLKDALTGTLDLGRLGLDSDKAIFDSRYKAGTFANDAQKQDFDQQKNLATFKFEEDKAANDIVKAIFEQRKDITGIDNKNAQQGFLDLRELANYNKDALGINNKLASDLATFRNDTIVDAGKLANENFTTDTKGYNDAITTALGQVNKAATGNTAPGPGISTVRGTENVDIAKIFNDFFKQNSDIFNSNTATDNQKTAALVQLLSQVLPEAIKGMTK